MANMQKASSGYVIASSLAKVFFGPHYDVLKEFNFNDQKQLDAWWQATDRIGFGAPYSANLQGLSKSGGKVIMWNGVSDPCCIDTELRGYYRDAAKSVGGVERLDKFAKLYFLPGTAHCGGGTGPEDAPDQLLEAMINWVEKAQPPPQSWHIGAIARANCSLIRKPEPFQESLYPRLQAPRAISCSARFHRSRNSIRRSLIRKEL